MSTESAAQTMRAVSPASRRALPAIVLVIAAWTSWSYLGQQGLMTWDEGTYYDEARFVVQAMAALRYGSAADIPKYTSGFAPRMARPLNTALNVAAMAVLGVRPWAPAALAGLFGILCIYGTYVLGRRVFDERAGLLAASLLLISPYFLQYRRMGLPEAAGAFVALLILLRLIVLRESEERRSLLNSLGLGLLMGVAFTINMRLGVLLPVAMLFRVAWLSGGKDARRIIGHVLTMAAGVAILLVIFELPYRLLPLFVTVPVPLESYWQQLARFASTQQGMGRPPLHLAYLAPVVFLLYFEAPVLLLSVWGVVAGRVGGFVREPVAGSGTNPPTRQPAVALLIACVLAQFVLLGLVAPFARYLSWVLPLLMIVAAQGLSQIHGRLQPRRAKAIVGIVLLVMIGHAAYRGGPVLHARGAMSQAAAWLFEHEADSIVISNASAAVAYMNNVHQLPTDPREAYDLIARLTRQGLCYVLLDRQQFMRGTFIMSPEEYQESAGGIISLGVPPVWKGRQFADLFAPFAFEHNRDILRTLRAVRGRGRGERMAIYEGLDAAAVLSVAD